MRNLTDMELLARIRAGDMEAEETLVARYAKNVRACARRFSLMGWDSEDFIQEGMLGLLRAAHTYSPESEKSLSAFIDLCVRRQLLNAVRRAKNAKNILLTDYVSYDAPVSCGDSTVPLGDTLSDDRASSFEEALLQQDRADRLFQSLSQVLSPMEKQVLMLYLSGEPVACIAGALSLKPKSVENAVGRIRRKAAALISQGDNRQ